MKIYKQTVIVAVIGIALTIGAYALGKSGKSDQTVSNNTYSTATDSVRKERDQIIADYNSACANYQILYTAYDTLYAKTGQSSGLQKVSRVDGARGNEESCYR